MQDSATRRIIAELSSQPALLLGVKAADVMVHYRITRSVAYKAIARARHAVANREATRG